jgi:hypothetical protein
LVHAERLHDPSFLAIVAIEYADGGSESCLLPLALIDGDAANAALKQTPSAVLARITGARKGAIVDGLTDDATCDRLVELIGGTREASTKHGSLRGTRTTVTLPSIDHAKWTRGQGDHGNTVAFMADRAVLKLFRRIEPTPSLNWRSAGIYRTWFSHRPQLAGALDTFVPADQARSRCCRRS